MLRLVSGAHFTTEDLVGAIRAALAEARCAERAFLLFDNRGSSENASHEELQRRATIFLGMIERFEPRVAIVVSDALHFGLGRIGAAYAGDAFDVAVFYDDAQAEQWLLNESMAASG